MTTTHSIPRFWLCALGLYLILPSHEIFCGEAAKGYPLTVVVSDPGTLPARLVERKGTRALANYMKKRRIKPGTNIQVTVDLFFDSGHSSSSNQMEPYIRTMVTLNDKGKPHGEAWHLEPRSHGPNRIVPYKEGLADGMEKITPYQGKPVHIPWVKGKIHGEKKTFHENGKICAQTTYVNGVAEGESKTFSRDGKCTRVAKMKKGKRHGEMKDFWANGTVKKVVMYNMGKVEGTMKEFYSNGKLKRVVPLKDNALHGKEIQYGSDGKEIKTRFWVDGELLGPKEFKEKTRKK